MLRMKSTRMLSPECKKRLKKLCIIYSSAVILGWVIILLNDKFGFGIPCIFHAATGLNCPSCGVSRMVRALLYGDFYGAYCLNRLMFISLPGFAYYIIRSSVQYVREGKCIFSKTDNIIFVIFIVCAVAFGAVRNIDIIIPQIKRFL